MSTEVTVRPARAEDAGAIAAIYNHYVLTSTATFDTEPKSAEDRRRWLVERDPRHPVLVAEREGLVLGWASLGPWNPRPAYRNTAEVGVYVAADEHGRGVGGRLVRQVIEAARAGGLHALIGQIVAGNEPSLQMSRTVGFELVGTLREVGHKFGRWLDVVVLEMRIGAKAEG